MIRWILCIGAVAGMSAAALVGGRTQLPVKQKGWHTNLEAARALAKESGKPLMVVFRCEP